MKTTRRLWSGLVVLLVGFAGAGWWLASDRVHGICGVIDRGTRSSGCVARYSIANFQPLPFVTMVPVDRRHVRLFGMAASDTGMVPTQLVLDLRTGEEDGRQELPLVKSSHLAIIPSQFGKRVAVICIMDDACDTARPQGLVLSVADGSIVKALQRANAFTWHFPGEMPRTVVAGAWLNDWVSAEPDMGDGGIILRDRTRQEIGRLTSGRGNRHVAAPNTMSVRVSSGGRYLAHIDSSHGRGTRLDIYDLPSKAIVETITIDEDHILDTSAIWMPDEQHLVFLAGRGSSRSDKLNTVTELYVFKVR